MGFTLLFKSRQSDTQIVTIQNAGESFLHTSPNIFRAETQEITGVLPFATHFSPGFPKCPQLHEGSLRYGNEARFNKNLLKVPIVFLNDPLKNGKLFPSPGGQNDVPLIVNFPRGAIEKLLDGVFDCWCPRGTISNKRFGFLVGHGHYITIFLTSLCFGNLISSENRRKNESLSESIDARFFDGFGFVLPIHNPNEIVTHLKLKGKISLNVFEKFTQPDFLEIDTELLLEGLK